MIVYSSASDFIACKKTLQEKVTAIDLIIYFVGTKQQKKDLDNWLEGWSLCLDEINYQRTGFKAGGLLHIKYIDTHPDNNSSNGLLTKLMLKNTNTL